MAVQTEISLKFSELLLMTIPVIGAITGWIWNLTSNNTKKTNNNETEIRLLNQTINTHKGKVDSMEDKVSKLTDEMIKMKFCIQSLDNKQDKNHIELLNAISALKG